MLNLFGVSCSRWVSWYRIGNANFLIANFNTRREFNEMLHDYKHGHGNGKWPRDTIFVMHSSCLNPSTHSTNSFFDLSVVLKINWFLVYDQCQFVGCFAEFGRWLN